LPQVLAAAGYQTAIFGKWHLGDEEPYQPHQRGFKETFIHGAGGIGQAFDCSCADVPNNSYFDPIIRHNGKFVQTRGFCTDVFFTAALGWIRQTSQEGQPFFAYIATNAPHDPFFAPPEAKQRFLDLGFAKEKAGFYGMIENIDANVGRLENHLEKWGLLENTVVIFLSDNGMSGGGSLPPGKSLGKTPEGEALFPYNAGMRGLKGSPDEGGVRVPFFFQWQGRVPGGRDIERVAAHIDLFPTTSPEWPDRMLVTHVGRWPQFADPAQFQWKGAALRTERFRLVNNEALYDMHADPGQTENVIDQHPELVARLRSDYDLWWAATLPKLINEQVPSSKVRPFHELFRAQQAAEGIPEWSPRSLDEWGPGGRWHHRESQSAPITGPFR
jgi:arylsulfatase A-like enzyme